MKAKLFFVLAMLTSAVAFGQGKYGATPEDSITCLQSLSIYGEFFRQGNYKDALTGWRTACRVCPRSQKSLYQNGVKMYSKFIKETEDADQKKLLVDTLLSIYDQRIANFKQEGYVLGRKGSDMLKYRRKEPRAAYDVLARSLELQGNKMEAGAMVYMYQALYYSYKKEQAQVEELFDVFSKVMPVIDYGEANGKNDKAKGRYTNARTKIEEIFSKVADCPSLVSIFTPKFEATPDDKELLKTILKLMDRKDCSDEALYTDAAVKLNELEPSAEAAYGIAQSKAKKDNCAEAVTYYKQAAELTEDEELKSKSLLNAAKCYLFMGQGQAARTYAQKALGVKGSLGEAYLVIANAYAKSAKSCGDNNCTNRSAYWVAVDKCVRAKSVDPSVAAKANKLIAGFSAQFPKKEDCFFHSINEGDSYTVGCWINETTTVRVRQ